MLPKDVTIASLDAIADVERLCSALSLLGCAFIAVTFLFSTAFRKPINRLVFYACLGNIFTNVATLITRSAIPHPNSFLCQFQGFLIQMFMPADACWAFAMALNVWLTFYQKYDAERIRRLEVIYFVTCYGIPFVPAIIFVFVETQKKGRLYGNALLWCWVSSDWDVFRLVTFYVPVWIVIGLTMAIYLRAGKDIYANRKKLLRIRNQQSTTHTSTIDNPFQGSGFQASKTTEISFISESADKNAEAGIFEMGPGGKVLRPSPYSVTCSGPSPSPRPDIENALPGSLAAEEPTAIRFPEPTSQNPNPAPVPMPRTASQSDNANWAYAKVACLFFVALMVTWIPSSANRVYSYVHPGEISLGLEFASAFVLPLQGFWNGLIYATTSLPACRQFWKEIKGSKAFRRNTIRRTSAPFPFGTEIHTGPPNSRSRMFTEIDSVISAESRPASKDSKS